MIPVEYFLILSALLFFIGVFGFVTRRDLVAMLISVELVLNSVDLNFAVFNRMLFPGQLEGFFFTLFSIGVSAAETAVALAIIINVYRNREQVMNKIKDAMILMDEIQKNVEKCRENTGALDELVMKVCDEMKTPHFLKNPLFKRTIESCMR